MKPTFGMKHFLRLNHIGPKVTKYSSPVIDIFSAAITAGIG
ncbi:hypothetical protein NNRS527_02609 [Nitrosospira sp. NRS527]|nr:hypothetical protein NNRS527_02609 [Nitrosospira sp. NRS527]